MNRYRRWITVIGSTITLLASTLTLAPPQSAAAATGAAAPVAAAPQVASLYSAGDLGRTVTFEGSIVRESHYSLGYRLWVNTPQGAAILNIHDEDYPTIANLAGLGNGAQVRVTGKVWKPYRDVYQVVPKSAAGITVLTAAANYAVRARHYDLGGLNGNDHAAMMVVQGEVINIYNCVVYGIDPRIDLDPADPAVCVTIRDATGAQNLALPIVASLQVSRQIYKIGNQVRAYGQLRGKPKKGIQIYVALPADVAVI